MTQSQTLPAIVRATQLDSPSAAAAAYAALGLSVLPLTGKRPALRSWKPFQKAPATPDQIAAWDRAGLLTNLGIVCGAVSGKLVVLDFDGMATYGAFCALFPALAETFTVRTGGGDGMHVYLYSDRLPATTRAMNTAFGHIELRADGCYVAAPPSIHPDSGQPYTVDKQLDVLRVPDLDDLVDWVADLSPKGQVEKTWQPPRDVLPRPEGINPAVIDAIADHLRGGRHRERGAWINCSCPYPEHHSNGDRHPSFGFNTESGYGHCYRCGTILARDLCITLDIDPAAYGGLMLAAPVPPLTGDIPPTVPVIEEEPIEAEARLDMGRLPDWLRDYVAWSGTVGNQTPLAFHLGMGLWASAVAIARRIHADTRWGIRLYPNLYMMFVADTTFYRKTTAYKLGEQVLTAAIPHLLMPTPGSPERFQDALAGRAPGNFGQLPEEHRQIVLEAQKFAAQRGLFKDEIAGLFGSFKRDYMAGLKDFLLEMYDCPDLVAKETQSGLTVVRNGALSILGVTTPAGLSGAISTADWDNGLLPRFALVTPEPDYHERTGLDEPLGPPEALIASIRALHDRLPMPQRKGDSWTPAPSLAATVTCWDEVQAYSNHLRQQCDPRRETPLDDRLKGLYGRLHVGALKAALICAALDWDESEEAPTVSIDHWQTGRAIAESWRLSAHRLLDALDRGGAGRDELRAQEKLLALFRSAGPAGLRLRDAYRALRMSAAVARTTAGELVRAGMLVERRIGGAEAYAVPLPNEYGRESA